MIVWTTKGDLIIFVSHDQMFEYAQELLPSFKREIQYYLRNGKVPENERTTIKISSDFEGKHMTLNQTQVNWRLR